MRRAELDNTSLARLGGIHRTQITRWLRGDSRPDHDKLRALCDGVRLTYPELSHLAADLWRAAGYGEQPPLPEVVRDNWGDKTVQGFWNLDLPEAERLGHIDLYLLRRSESAPADDGTEDDSSEDAG